MNEPFESVGGHKLLAVHWVDTAKGDKEHFTVDQLKTFRPVEAWIVGWGFVLPDRVVLGCEYFPDGPDQPEGYRVAFTIPTRSITQVIELTAKEGSDA